MAPLQQQQAGAGKRGQHEEKGHLQAIDPPHAGGAAHQHAAGGTDPGRPAAELLGNEAEQERRESFDV